MSNIDIKVTADVADLQTKFALAKAQTSALSTELNKLAKEANAAGGPSTELKAKMDGVASQFVATKARASDLRTELANATGGMGSFSGAIASAVPLLETFGLAISAAGIFEFAKGIVTTAADIQHQADALGIGAERLQAYQFAARESGVSVDEAGTAFKRFFANLGELQTTGEGSLAKYLSELGLTADELAGDPTEALVIFARALDKETDATIRAAAERAAFGRSGIDLNALMHKLAEGTGDVTDKVKGLEDEAKAAGQVMDNQATEGAKHFEEALDGVKVRAESGVLAIAELIHQVWELGGAEQEQMLLQERLAKRRLLPANLHPGPQGLPPVPNPTFLTPQGPDVTDPVINIAKDGGAGSNKAANDARRMADEIAQAYVQSNEKRIEGEAQTNSFLLEMGQESIGQFVEQARKLENERYAVEVEGLKKREAADAGDKVALVKDKADEEVIAREHANKLAAIDQDYGRKKKQIAETELQDFIQTKQDELTADIEGVEAQFKEHRTSAQQRHDLEHAFTADIERQVLARFDAEHVGLVKGTEAYAQAMKERQKLIDGFAKHELQQDNQLVEQEMQKWHELSSSIEGSFNGALNQMLLHGGSFQDFMSSVAIGVAEAFLQMGEKMIETWIEQQIFSQASDAASSIVKITDAAAVGAANAYAQYAAYPPIAAAMAAQAFSTIESFTGFLAAEKGEYMVRGDNVPYLLHDREMVLPAPVADAVRQGPRSFDGSMAGGRAATISHSHAHTWNIGSDIGFDHMLRDPNKRRILERYIENEFARAVK
jgi:hypothetical protein